MNCSKCGTVLTGGNTEHKLGGGRVKWCDACWMEFWNGYHLTEELERLSQYRVVKFCPR